MHLVLLVESDHADLPEPDEWSGEEKGFNLGAYYSREVGEGDGMKQRAFQCEAQQAIGSYNWWALLECDLVRLVMYCVSS